MNSIIQWCNANQGFLSGCLSLAYVVATIWLVSLARKQLANAAELERSRTRPFVTFELILDPPYVMVHITNSGQRSAKDLRITISPRLQCVLGGEGSVPAEERTLDIAFIERGVAMLSPGRTITAIAGPWRRFRSAYPELRFEGKLSYQDDAGYPYVENFIIDLSAYKDVLYRQTSGIADVAKQLEAIGRTLNQFATGYTKPLIRTMTEEQYRAEENAFIEEAEKGLRKPMD